MLFMAGLASLTNTGHSIAAGLTPQATVNEKFMPLYIGFILLVIIAAYIAASKYFGGRKP